MATPTVTDAMANTGVMASMDGIIHIMLLAQGMVITHTDTVLTTAATTEILTMTL